VTRGASRWGLLDRPNERSSHTRVTPKGGGLGILLAWMLTSLWLSVPLWFWLPMAVMSMASFVGDRLHLSQVLRLGVQSLCCGVVIAGILSQRISGGPMTPGWFAGILWVGLTLFAVGTANYYNFMDGINGIAGLTGVVAFGFMGIYIRRHVPDVFPAYGVLAWAIAAACIGFLPFNVPRARVFMGDVGSILLGAVFGCLVTLSSRTLLDFVCLCGFLFPFYADEVSTAIVRLQDRQNLLLPHRRHTYQILANQLKIPHWRVSVGYAGLQVTVALGVLVLRPFGIKWVIGMLAALFLLFCGVGIIVRRSEGEAQA
jgi:Fuc2NAc and GlcNAc transferase